MHSGIIPSKAPTAVVDKHKWLKSLVPKGTKRLPRRLKKEYLKYYSPVYFAVINKTQFLNIYGGNNGTIC